MNILISERLKDKKNPYTSDIIVKTTEEAHEILEEFESLADYSVRP